MTERNHTVVTPVTSSRDMFSNAWHIEVKGDSGKFTGIRSDLKVAESVASFYAKVLGAPDKVVVASY